MMRELTVRLIIGALVFAWSSVSYGSESSQIAKALRHVEAPISNGQREHADIQTERAQTALMHLEIAEKVKSNPNVIETTKDIEQGKMAYNEWDRPGSCPEGPPCENTGDRPGGCPEGPPCKNKNRVTYKPAEAIDMVVAKIQVAIEGISKGASADEVATLIKQASNASKEINANDKVGNARSKANRKLKTAITHAKESSLQKAEEDLRDAKKDFEALKSAL